MIYKQLKDLPFSKKGSMWIVRKTDKWASGLEIIIDETNYSLLELYQSFVGYYRNDENVIEMEDDVWFKKVSDDEEEELERIKALHELSTEKEYLEERLKQIKMIIKKVKQSRKH